MGALLALATASFCYVTAETLPIGLLPQMSRGLHVSESQVGLLLTIYAAVAGLTAIPLTALTAHLPRKQLMGVLVAMFAVSQLATAIAPTYAWLVAARLLCALAHGVFWSVVIPIATRIAGPGRSAKGTGIVFGGNSLAVVLGTPLATALGTVLGWRMAIAVVGLAGVASVVAILWLLPELDAEPGPTGAVRALRAIPGVLRNRRLVIVCLTNLVLVVGLFTAYTYISLIVQRDSGLHDLALACVLLAYGVAGVAGNLVVATMADRSPRRSALVACLGVGIALFILTFKVGVAFTIVAVVIWGIGAVANPVALQTAVLRVASTVKDTASAVFVVSYQIGIGGGALLGGMLVSAGLTRELTIVGAITAVVAAALVVSSSAAFPRLVETVGHSD